MKDNQVYTMLRTINKKQIQRTKLSLAHLKEPVLDVSNGEYIWLMNQAADFYPVQSRNVQLNTSPVYSKGEVCLQTVMSIIASAKHRSPIFYHSWQ